jgi:hypothetical protein
MRWFRISQVNSILEISILIFEFLYFVLQLNTRVPILLNGHICTPLTPAMAATEMAPIRSPGLISRAKG